ncbi:DegT/DnrJ/EryC1/StrS family aminotransferase [Methylophilaceae bacterium]|nr:DegT/DnrJ/EryC1/StrS family aminotransferase [Methylophilaceae bacterium]
MNVPFNDLYLQYCEIKEEIDSAINDVIKNSAFVRGSEVENFEFNFAQKIGVKNCISCANGTDALYISMFALGLKPGDEVIVPAHSWISTSETVTQAGGIPIFCDTGIDNFTINADLIEALITNRTVGIIPVHLFGQPADMDPIKNIAEKYNLWILEDCAQSHLAKYKNKMVGTIGVAGSFSFYPGKNLGAMGDAGAIVTNDDILAEKMRKFSRHGGLSKGLHDIEGINSRMDGIQAAVLNVKLRYLSDWTRNRQAIALKYLHIIRPRKDISLPLVEAYAEHVWHLFVIKSNQREALMKFLNENGIATVINYPIALPFLKAYQRMLKKPDDFPSAFFNQSKILSIPIYPGMTEQQITYVGSKVNQFNQPL